MADTMKCDLNPISSAVSRAVTCIKGLVAENDALKAKAEQDQAKIDELTALLESTIPDAGGAAVGAGGGGGS